MEKPITRRRFITISAAATGAALFMPGMSQANKTSATTEHLYSWRGRALGAEAEILLNIPPSVDGDGLIVELTNEIARLEKIFSLYRGDSELTYLNENGYLSDPAPELVDVLFQADHISRLTDGAFDVTVQPLWQLYKENHEMTIHEGLVEKILQLVDYREVSISAKAIELNKPGMAITLNGIAQGYITDRVARLLASHKMNNCLVQLGEMRAIGGHPSGRDWDVGVNGSSDQTVNLNNQSIATSGTTTIENPIFTPENGKIVHKYNSVSVVAKTATIADALSTAFSSMDEAKIHLVIERLPDIEIHIS